MPRSPTQLETMVAFTPDRLINYIRLERLTATFGLDPALRYSTARRLATEHELPPGAQVHRLEEEFNLSSAEILDIIDQRHRLNVAVKGGVAERHLENTLLNDPTVTTVHRLDADGQHDFDVTLANGQRLRIECKNASPERYANGNFRVEVQKTRASKGDPASRYYRIDAFDVVAACLYSATGEWTFRFESTARLSRHTQFPDRLAALHRIDDTWSKTLAPWA